MFWPEEEEDGWPVYTQNDLHTFAHILYLDVPAEVVAQRHLDDTERSRPSTSVTHLRKWQQAEKAQLHRLYRHHSILFLLISQHPTLLNKVLTLLRDFCRHTEQYNLSQAENRLDEALVAGQGQLETVLVMDADRTLAAEDTGALFWKRVSSSRRPRDEDCPLKALFSSPLGYSYTAFRQATLLYEETADDQEFDALCQDVASVVTMHPEFVSMLQLVAEQEHVGAVIVSCGLRRVWDKGAGERRSVQDSESHRRGTHRRPLHHYSCSEKRLGRSFARYPPDVCLGIRRLSAGLGNVEQGRLSHRRGWRGAGQEQDHGRGFDECH
jgi:hypothetical protein